MLRFRAACYQTRQRFTISSARSQVSADFAPRRRLRYRHGTTSGRVFMLKGFRKAGESWVGKAVITVLFGLLIVSFAVWGIGDIFRHTGPS
jgi:hypothetical protein